jgi:hypothetical protein
MDQVPGKVGPGADAVRPSQCVWEVSFQRGGDPWTARLTAAATTKPEGLA